MAKEVVDRKEAVASEKPAAESNPTPAVKRYSFVKNQNPGEAVRIGDRVIQFHCPVRPDGTKGTFGIYVTKDPDEAKALREFASNNPTFYIFEKA